MGGVPIMYISGVVYIASGNFQGIYISRTSLVQASIREIKILEFENEGPFVRYTGLENNHLYGSYCIIIGV